MPAGRLGRSEHEIEHKSPQAPLSSTPEANLDTASMPLHFHNGYATPHIGRALGIALLWLVCSSWVPGTAADKTAADYYVDHLPGAPQPLLKMHAGHIEITPEHHGNIFFWLFQNRHIANRQRTVLWLNGGPGCSSMDGALMEIGPYRVKADGTLEYNDGSWDEFANIVFVDQPVGTGFSYVDTDSYIHELKDMATQMVKFLEKYFLLFPEQSLDDLYIAGESYAGQYIPYVAQAILDRNAQTNEPHWSLGGLLIGNGWISSPEQYLSYLPFAYSMGILQGGSEQAKKIEAQQAVCVKDLDGNRNHVDVPSCEMILQELLRVSRELPQYHGKCLNMYDVRLEDDYPSCGMAWPSDLAQVTPYLRRKDVTTALHINTDKKTGWTECNNQVGNAFNARNSKPSRELLPGLLEQVPIILFSGDQDLICNHIGTEDLISRLSWNGGTGMEDSSGVVAPQLDWTFDGQPAGIWQSARNLTYIKFYNSSHMVPFDFPKRTRDMLDRFMGVDPSAAGSRPVNSQIGDEKEIVGSPGNSTTPGDSEAADKERLKQATWRAYYKSGEVALVVVVIVVGVWGYFIWRARRRHAGYKGLFGNDSQDGSRGAIRLNGFAKGRGHRDVEAADFDEAELDDLGHGRHDVDEERFDLGDDSDAEENGVGNGKTNGHR